MRYALKESGCLGMQPKVGGKYHLKLNIGERPIANKYREGKMKRTLKRELKVREIVKRETLETSILAVETVLYLLVWGRSRYVAGQHQFGLWRKKPRGR